MSNQTEVKPFHEVRTCRRAGCPRQARGTSIYCGVHLLEVVEAGTSLTEAVDALEKLAEAAHALLWDWESGSRRGLRRPGHTATLARNLRYATRRAEDVLSPIIREE